MAKWVDEKAQSVKGARRDFLGSIQLLAVSLVIVAIFVVKGTSVSWKGDSAHICVVGIVVMSMFIFLGAISSIRTYRHLKRAKYEQDQDPLGH
jgi:ACR3 family arsenite efflux pump ArsB